MTNSKLLEHFLDLIQTPRSDEIFYTPIEVVNHAVFFSKSLSLASALEKRKEQKWLLWAENAGDFLVQFTALFLAKKHIVLPGNAHPGTLNALSNNYDALLLDQTIAGYPAQNSQFQLIASELETRAPSPISLATDITITIFTSGSTGEAKAVHKQLSQFLQEIDTLAPLWSDTLETHCVLTTVSHQHIYGLLHACLWPFWRRAAFYAEIHQYPEELMAVAELKQPCVLISSPTHLARMPSSNDFIAQKKSFRAIFSSAGLLDYKSAQQIQKICGFSPIEIFGSTETGGVAWRQQGTEENAPWRAFPNCHLSQDESKCLIVHSAQAGELPCVMGDRVTLKSDGSFQLLGRADKIVKVEGKRLSLTELEQRLSAHPLVNQARAITITKKRDEVCAVVTVHNDAKQLEKRELVSQLKAHLARFYERILIPRRWRFVKSFPVDQQGKVTFSELRRCFEEAS